jgi:hypothetical protein
MLYHDLYLAVIVPGVRIMKHTITGKVHPHDRQDPEDERNSKNDGQNQENEEPCPVGIEPLHESHRDLHR